MKLFTVKVPDSIIKNGNVVTEFLLAIAVRVAIVNVFWNSAQTKINDWEVMGQSLKFFNLNDSTFFLFQYEYNVPLIPHNVAAYMATATEFFLSLAIALGFMTRLSALGLLGMTAVIQIFVYPSAWPEHLFWAIGLLYLVRYGAGPISVDGLAKSSLAR